MTLRCTLEIVPYGDENYKRTITVFNIHNLRTVEHLGFGNVICQYQVDVKEEIKAEAFDVFRVEHNRKDGAAELVRKVLEKYVNECV